VSCYRQPRKPKQGAESFAVASLGAYLSAYGASESGSNGLPQDLDEARDTGARRISNAGMKAEKPISCKA
jgi:hypothetical protein